MTSKASTQRLVHRQAYGDLDGVKIRRGGFRREGQFEVLTEVGEFLDETFMSESEHSRATERPTCDFFCCTSSSWRRSSSSRARCAALNVKERSVLLIAEMQTNLFFISSNRFEIGRVLFFEQTVSGMAHISPFAKRTHINHSSPRIRSLPVVFERLIGMLNAIDDLGEVLVGI